MNNQDSFLQEKKMKHVGLNLERSKGFQMERGVSKEMLDMEDGRLILQ